MNDLLLILATAVWLMSGALGLVVGHRKGRSLGAVAAVMAASIGLPFLLSLALTVQGLSPIGAVMVGTLCFFVTAPAPLIFAAVGGSDRAALERRALESGELRRCPFCAEVIRGDAKICRFCNRDLQTTTAKLTPETAAHGTVKSPSPPLPPSALPEETASPASQSRIGIWMVAAAVLLLLTLAMWSKYAFNTDPHLAWEAQRDEWARIHALEAEPKAVTAMEGCMDGHGFVWVSGTGWLAKAPSGKRPLAMPGSLFARLGERDPARLREAWTECYATIPQPEKSAGK